MSEPAKLRRRQITLKAETESGFSGRTDLAQRGIALEQSEVGVDRVVSRDGVQDEVEAIRMLRHLLGVL